MTVNFSNIYSDITNWIKSVGLLVLLIALGSILASRLVHWFGDKVSDSIKKSARAQIRDDFVLSERNKHTAAVVQAVEWAAVALIYSVAIILGLMAIKIPITSLVAPATVLGVALGFGAQKVVADLVAGFFVFAERQFGVGDIIRISAPGTLGGIAGTVEEVTLRITRIRNLAGEQIILPNSEIRQVVNLSREWSQVVVDFPINPSVDLSEVRRRLDDLAIDLTKSESLANQLAGAIVVTGIESISPGVVTIRMLAKTLPAQQWEVARVIRAKGVEVLADLNALVRPESINLNYGP
ncbi:MAG: mechanosensitive ion channel family protein [Actinomycetota bacterium]|nr:mechanosensitive ion channel family protein [Actinomycetota bacterium]